MKRPPEAHVIYEAVAADGTVLYVGTTGNIHVRLMAHRSQSSFWAEVDHWRITPCRNRVAALDTERALIAQHRPAHNIDGNTPRVERGSRIDDVLRLLMESGPMNTAELRSAMGGYRNASTITTRLHAKGAIKAIEWHNAGHRTGWTAVWAHRNDPSPEMPHPRTQRVAA